MKKVLILAMISSIVLLNVKNMNSECDKLICESYFQNVSNIRYNVELCNEQSYDENWENIILNADMVVEGIIQDVEYLVNDGIAWTKLLVKIEDKGDVIPIYILGGYIDSDTYNKYYDVDIECKWVHATQSELNDDMKIGKKILAVLIKTAPDGPFEIESYEGYYGIKTIYLRDAKGYYNYNEKNNKTYLNSEELTLAKKTIYADKEQKDEE